MAKKNKNVGMSILSVAAAVAVNAAVGYVVMHTGGEITPQAVYSVAKDLTKKVMDAIPTNAKALGKGNG